MGKAANVMPVAAAGPARLTDLCPPLPGIVSLMLASPLPYGGTSSIGCPTQMSPSCSPSAAFTWIHRASWTGCSASRRTTRTQHAPTGTVF